MAAISPLLCILFTIVINLSLSNAVWCRQSVNFITNPKNVTRCIGDYCIKEILKFVDGSNIVQFGCINGFEVAPGCFNDVQNNIVVCFCNHRDMCNTEETDSKTVKMKKKIDCHDGEVVDGKLIGNATCRGELCYLSGNVVDSASNILAVAGCVPGVVPNFYGQGCLISQNFEEGKASRIKRRHLIETSVIFT